MSIEQLKERGYTVRFDHLRFWKNKKVLSHGGSTIAWIYRGDRKNAVAVGVANCSLSDPFNKKLGRQIALGRAVCQLTGERERRDNRIQEERKQNLRYLQEAAS